MKKDILCLPQRLRSPATFNGFFLRASCTFFFLEPADKQIVQQTNQAENILNRDNEAELKYMERKQLTVLTNLIQLQGKTLKIKIALR